jgi:hypothetical protein
MKSNRNVSIMRRGADPAVSSRIGTRRVGRAALGVLALLGSTAAQALEDFTGYYDVANWTTESWLGDPAAMVPPPYPECDPIANSFPTGCVDTTGAPDSITIRGPNDPALDEPDPELPGYFDFTISVGWSTGWFFDWSYLSDDGLPDPGDPGFDGAGWLLNGTFTLLSDDALGASGSFALDVKAGDTIGFRVYTTDSKFGAGYLTISNFAMPEPSTLPLLALGAAGIFTARRRARLAGLAPR